MINALPKPLSMPRDLLGLALGEADALSDIDDRLPRAQGLRGYVVDNPGPASQSTPSAALAHRQCATRHRSHYTITQLKH